MAGRGCNRSQIPGREFGLSEIGASSGFQAKEKRQDLCLFSLMHTGQVDRQGSGFPACSAPESREGQGLGAEPVSAGKEGCLKGACSQSTTVPVQAMGRMG